MDAEALFAPADYGADITGDVQGAVLTDPQMWENFIKSARDHKYAQISAGVTANDSGHNLYDLIKKIEREGKYEVGSVHQFLDHKAPVVWDPTSKTTVDSYFPALDLSAITTSQTIDSTGTSSGLSLSPITKLVAPAAVTWLRARKLTIRNGMTSPKSDFTLSTYSLTSNVVTLTFAVDSDVTAILAAINESALAQGASADLLTYTATYTSGPVINIPTALGAIPAGDYTISSVTSSTRQLTFAYTSGNIGSTGSSVQCAFYPHRIVGSTTTARISAIQGRALVGANDGALENVTPLMRRGRFQSHYHLPLSPAVNFVESVASGGTAALVGGTTQLGSATTGAPTTDGASGTPRTGPETDIRNIAVHFYLGLGAVES